MKYRRFNYSAGYVGTDTSEVFAFSDSYTEKEIEEIFNDWYEEQRYDSGDINEISEEDAEEEGISDIYE